jgi:SOS-response transcriptional repressor LexA
MCGKTSITALDESVYDFVERFTRIHGYPPESIAFVANGMGENASSVRGSIAKLVRLGALERQQRNRAPILIAGPLSLERL